MTPRRCSRCGLGEPAVRFHPRSKVTQCVPCNRAYQRERYRARHGGKVRRYSKVPAVATISAAHDLMQAMRAWSPNV